MEHNWGKAMARVAKTRTQALDELKAINPKVCFDFSICVRVLGVCVRFTRFSSHAALLQSYTQLYYASLEPDRNEWPLHFPIPTDTPPIEDYTTTEEVKI